MKPQHIIRTLKYLYFNGFGGAIATEVILFVVVNGQKIFLHVQ